MNKQTTDIVAYLSWPGLLIAFFIGDRYGSRFHLNQSLVIWIASTLVGFAARWLPLFGWVVGLIGGLFFAWRGSKNQRVINVPASLARCEVVIIPDN